MSVDLKNIPIDYATKDFEGFMEMFKDTIPILTPEWTDLSDSDQGVVILQLLAYGLHIQSFNIDKGVAENLLPIAKTQRSIYDLAKFLGYDIKLQTPSIVNMTFMKTEDALNKDVIIPENTQISTDPEFGDPVIFETDEPLVIPNGQTTGVVSATQGETVLQEDIGVGTGAENQTAVIEQTEVIVESLQFLTVENGTVFSWERVSNFLDSLPNSRHYTTELTEDGGTRLIFGNGVTGIRVPSGAEMLVTFRHGGGTKGNLAAGLINTLVEGDLADIELAVNNEASTSGTDVEDLEQARNLAPKSYRTGGKAVTVEDFQDIAEGFPGVARAVCVETFNANSDVNLYLASSTGDDVPVVLREAVKNHVESVMVMNQNLNVYGVLYKDYDLQITVYIQDNFSRASVETALKGILRDFLKPTNFQFGDAVYLSGIVHQAMFTGGVRNAVVNAPAGDIKPGPTELPRLKNLTVVVAGGVA